MPPSAASLRVVMISRRSNVEVEMPESPVAVVTATIAVTLAVGGNTVPPTRLHLPPLPAPPPLQVGLLGTVTGVVGPGSLRGCQHGLSGG